MFEIRKATLDDLPVIQKLANIAFPHTYKDILSPEQLVYMMEWMYSDESIRQQMIAEGHLYYIAYKGEEPVGYVSICPEGDHTFHLQKLYILPDHQGCQLGRTLFNHAIASIKEIHPGPCQMRLNVNRYNKAVDFYYRMGMKKVDEGDFHIGHGFYMTDYIMGIDI